ncbi:MAG: DNA repair protein RecN [Candidatus Omnitrophota bacterium]
MITQLSIENFGLIDKISLDFAASLNILTGETGAGKSIIIDALRFGLGEPFSASQARDADKPSCVEIVLDLVSKELREHLLIADFLEGGEETLIINRLQHVDGRKKIKINGRSILVSQLKALGNLLVDFHGAHDHQLILSEDSHLSILDRLTDFGSVKSEYLECFEKHKDISEKIAKIEQARSGAQREIDSLSYQVKELEQVPLDASVYEEARQKQVQLNNTEKLYEHINHLMEIFDNDETGLARLISSAFTPLRQLNNIDSSTQNFTEILSQMQEQASDLSSALQSYKDGLSFEPQEALKINQACDMYDEIKRKYGPSLEDAKKFYEEAKKRYEFLVNLDHDDACLREELGELEKGLKTFAAKITSLRKKMAYLLKETIEHELSELGIVKARFECRLEKADFNAQGADRVVFYLSPNAGEDLKPLAEIVSSGEAARLMLALKKALTQVDTVPVLIFDEIDAQIGGRLGTITGRKLKELSSNRQVILITHLPQIASFADQHFRVCKKVEGNRTVTLVELLDKDARVKEMAQMMSGEQESKVSLEHARDMMSQSKSNEVTRHQVTRTPSHQKKQKQKQK